MAMNIGGARDFGDVDGAAFDAFAKKCDINPKFVHSRIEWLADGISRSMDDVAAELSDGGHPSPVYKEISAQSLKRLFQVFGRKLS